MPPHSRKRQHQNTHSAAQEQALLALNDRDSALRLYLELERALKQELDTLPQAALRELYRTLKFQLFNPKSASQDAAGLRVAKSATMNRYEMAANCSGEYGISCSSHHDNTPTDPLET